VLVYGLREDGVVILRLVRAERDMAALLEQGPEPGPEADDEREDIEPPRG
jgi:hypothetical protein